MKHLEINMRVERESVARIHDVWYQISTEGKGVGLIREGFMEGADLKL